MSLNHWHPGDKFTWDDNNWLDSQGNKTDLQPGNYESEDGKVWLKVTSQKKSSFLVRWYDVYFSLPQLLIMFGTIAVVTSLNGWSQANFGNATWSTMGVFALFSALRAWRTGR